MSFKVRYRIKYGDWKETEDIEPVRLAVLNLHPTETLEIHGPDC